MRTILAHKLNNRGELILIDNKPVPIHFTDLMWEQIQKFEYPKFKFIKYLDETIGKKVDVKATVIKAKTEEVFDTLKYTVKTFNENLDKFSKPQLQAFVKDSRVTISRFAKEKLGK